MKKVFTTILIAFALVFVGLSAKAQWVNQISGTTDTLGNVFFTDASHGWACGDTQAGNSIALHTTDGGVNWNPVAAGVFSHPCSIYFTDANHGYVGGYDTIYKTIDGGGTWTKYVIGTGTLIASSIYFYNDTIGYATVVDVSTFIPTIYHTIDAGLTWTAAITGSTGVSPGSNNLAAISTTTCFSVGYIGNYGIYKTIDGGANWISNFNPIENLGTICFIDATTGFAGGGTPMRIYRTTNGGITWGPVYTGINGGIQSIHFSDINTGYAVGDSGTIITTINGGGTWTAMTSPTIHGLHGLSFPVANTGYAVGDSGTILKYTNSSGIWEPSDAENSVSVYPDPASTSITIHQSTISANQQLLITDILGNSVYSQSINNSSQSTINVSQWSNGVYFYKITKENGTERGKFMIEK